MKWKRTRSRDVIDVRGASGGRRAGGGMGGMSMPGGMKGLGGGAGLVVLLVFLGIQLLGGGGGGSGFDIGQILAPGVQAPGAANPQPIPPAEDPQRDLKDFSTYVFEDTQGLWQTALSSEGVGYDKAQLVLYRAPSRPRAAAAPPRRSGPSTARPTAASTSTSPSTTT